MPRQNVKLAQTKIHQNPQRKIIIILHARLLEIASPKYLKPQEPWMEEAED